MCYPGSIVSKRPGITRKISISLRSSDLASLRRRAKRLYGGNVSAVIAELAADAALLEGMNDLVSQLGGPGLTDEDRERFDVEWARQPSSAGTRGRPRKPRKAA